MQTTCRQDGSTYPTYLVKQTGRYSVIINNQCGSLSDTVTIQKVDANYLYPIVLRQMEMAKMIFQGADLRQF
ncbi:MAG: hypothetical protein IPL50_09490 [Chitinophagaceae bacterium]|nr:hypothetical protein [Chitinophagaceae bacterium]